MRLTLPASDTAELQHRTAALRPDVEGLNLRCTFHRLGGQKPRVGLIRVAAPADQLTIASARAAVLQGAGEPFGAADADDSQRLRRGAELAGGGSELPGVV